MCKMFRKRNLEEIFDKYKDYQNYFLQIGEVIFVGTASEFLF